MEVALNVLELIHLCFLLKKLRLLTLILQCMYGKETIQAKNVFLKITLLFAETTTKNTLWSPGCTSEFMQHLTAWRCRLLQHLEWRGMLFMRTMHTIAYTIFLQSFFNHGKETTWWLFSVISGLMYVIPFRLFFFCIAHILYLLDTLKKTLYFVW